MRLLIVEDDQDGREMLAELFRMHEWSVTSVPTTSAAMVELRGGGFDVVISDEDLQGQSGSTMLREASAEGLLTNVGVLMYTADPGWLRVPAGVKVLRKPLGLTKLLDEAKAVAPDDTVAPSGAATWGAVTPGQNGKRGSPVPDSGRRSRSRSVELVLYVTSSDSSQRALRNLEGVFAKIAPARVRVLVHDLEREPLADSADHDHVAPRLVKTQPGQDPMCFAVELESSQRLTALIEQLEADAPVSSQAFGESPPSSRHLR